MTTPPDPLAAARGAKRRIPSASALLRDIRRYCLECCCGQTSEVERCICRRCIMYPHRMGITGYRHPERYELDGGEGYLELTSDET